MHTVFSVFQKFAPQIITEADVQEDPSNQSNTFHFTRVDHMTQVVHPEIFRGLLFWGRLERLRIDLPIF